MSHLVEFTLSLNMSMYGEKIHFLTSKQCSLWLLFYPSLQGTFVTEKNIRNKKNEGKKEKVIKAKEHSRSSHLP